MTIRLFAHISLVNSEEEQYSVKLSQYHYQCLDQKESWLLPCSCHTGLYSIPFQKSAMKAAVFFFFFSAVSGDMLILNSTDGKPCIMLNVEAVFNITAENNKKEFNTALNISSTKYKVSGFCTTENATLHMMTLTFDNSAEWTLTFSQNDDNTTVTLSHTFTFNASRLDNNKWPPADFSFSNNGSGLHIPYNGSYLCNAEQHEQLASSENVKENFTFSVHLAFSKVQVQAFNIKGGVFSPAEECSLDNNVTTVETTTKESTTPTEHTTSAHVTTAELNTTAHVTTAELNTTAHVTTAEHNTTAHVTTPEHSTPGNTTLPPTVKPTHAPPIEPPEATKYVVRNGSDAVCIYFTSIIGLKNLTFTDDESEGFDIFIPFNGNFSADTNVSVTGNCSFKNEDTNKTQSNMVIKFNENWTLSFVFEEDTQATSYSLKEIHFTYFWKTNGTTLGAFETAHNKTVKNTNVTDFLKSSLPGSYKCNSELTTYIGGGISMETKKLQYKAFATDNKEDFTKEPVTQCSADSESNSIVPIAVGAALAGLVVIVLIAYLIGRHRSRRAGYESV